MLKQLSKFGLLLPLMVTLCVGQQSSMEKEGNNWTRITNGSLSGVHNLRIQVENGSVKVHGGSPQGIEYVIRNRAYESSDEQSRRQLENYRISTYTRGDTAWIVGDWRSGNVHRFSSEVSVNVPRDIESVKIETAGGEIVTTGISGRLEAQTAGGAIHVDDIGGSVNVETGGGAVDVGSVGGDLNVRTGGGTVKIGSVKGKVTAETAGGEMIVMSAAQGASLQTGAGSIRVNKCNGTVKASTAGGGIELGEISGGATIETAGGSLKVVSASGPVNAETAGGSIELWGVPSARVETAAGAITAKFIGGAQRSDSLLETAVGDITVYVVPNINLTIRANIEAANGHKIFSDFPEIKVSVEGGQWGPKLVSAEGNLNGGGPVVKVRTTMGNIYLRRAQ